MTDEIVKNLINSNETFDAVIVEVFAFDALLGLGQHFNCPVIPTNHYDPLYWNNFFAGNDAPQSYVPNNNLGFTDRMSFTQRLFNVIFSEIEKVTFNLYHIRKQVCMQITYKTHYAAYRIFFIILTIRNNVILARTL